MGKVTKRRWKNKNGKWTVRWEARWYINGKTRTKICEKKADADKILAENVLEPMEDTKITFGQVAERWLEKKRGAVRPQTLKRYETVVRKHLLPQFGQRRIAKIPHYGLVSFLQRLLDERGLSRRRVGFVANALQQIFKMAAHPGNCWIRRNPAVELVSELRLDDPDHVVKAFERAQLKAILAAASVWTYPQFLLLARTGVRVGEGLALEWRDLNFDTRKVGITKTLGEDGNPHKPKTKAAIRDVPMSDDLYSALKDWRRTQLEAKLRNGWPEQPKYVCIQEDSRQMTYGQLRHRFIGAREAAKLPPHFTLHSFRHTFAARALQKRVDPAVLKEMLGHANYKETVDLYGHWFSKAVESDVNVQDDTKPQKLEDVEKLEKNGE